MSDRSDKRGGGKKAPTITMEARGARREDANQI